MTLTPGEGINRTDVVEISSAGYYENPWLNNIRQIINRDNMQRFVDNNLILFDNALPEDEFLNDDFYAKLANSWGKLQNSEFFYLCKEVYQKTFSPHARDVLKAQVVHERFCECKRFCHLMLTHYLSKPILTIPNFSYGPMGIIQDGMPI